MIKMTDGEYSLKMYQTEMGYKFIWETIQSRSKDVFWWEWKLILKIVLWEIVNWRTVN